MFISFYNIVFVMYVSYFTTYDSQIYTLRDGENRAKISYRVFPRKIPFSIDYFRYFYNTDHYFFRYDIVKRNIRDNSYVFIFDCFSFCPFYWVSTEQMRSMATDLTIVSTVSHCDIIADLSFEESNNMDIWSFAARSSFKLELLNYDIKSSPHLVICLIERNNSLVEDIPATCRQISLNEFKQTKLENNRQAFVIFSESYIFIRWYGQPVFRCYQRGAHPPQWELIIRRMLREVWGYDGEWE